MCNRNLRRSPLSLRRLVDVRRATGAPPSPFPPVRAIAAVSSGRDDRTQVGPPDEPARERLALLLGPGAGRRCGQELGKYGFGTLRTEDGQKCLQLALVSAD